MSDGVDNCRDGMLFEVKWVMGWSWFCCDV